MQILGWSMAISMRIKHDQTWSNYINQTIYQMCHDVHGTSLNSGVGPSSLAVAASIHGISGALIFRRRVRLAFPHPSGVSHYWSWPWQSDGSRFGSLVSRIARNDKANTKKAQKAPSAPCTVTVWIGPGFPSVFPQRLGRELEKGSCALFCQALKSELKAMRWGDHGMAVGQHCSFRSKTKLVASQTKPFFPQKLLSCFCMHLLCVSVLWGSCLKLRKMTWLWTVATWWSVSSVQVFQIAQKSYPGKCGELFAAWFTLC